MKQKTLSPIGYVKSDFSQKFGVPRQSGRSPNSVGKIEFVNEFSNAQAFKGLENFSHIWILFDFSLCDGKWSKMIRPPRLGGNKKVGVFASRSPFRPNGIGLSSVKLEKILTDNDGKVSLLVSGIDLVDGTPVYDIKPYLPSSDCHPNASGGFADEFTDYKLTVDFPKNLLEIIPQDKRTALTECLADDPRPSYQTDEREYGMSFAGFNVKFKVIKTTLHVLSIEKNK